MRCKECGSTDARLFYESIATYCKEHWKIRVRKNRKANADYYTLYDYMRNASVHRLEARRKYNQTPKGRAAHAKANEKYRENNMQKKRAHNLVAKALMRGKMKPSPCIICGAVAEAHHPDYSKPLDVVWLCDKHHKEEHARKKYA